MIAQQVRQPCTFHEAQRILEHLESSMACAGGVGTSAAAPFLSGVEASYPEPPD